MIYRYYTTQRPPTPGAIPAGVVHPHSYDDKIYIDGIGGVWGYADYKTPLDDATIKQFDLVDGQQKIFYPLQIGIYTDGAIKAVKKSAVKAVTKPADTIKVYKNVEIYTYYFNTDADRERFINDL